MVSKASSQTVEKQFPTVFMELSWSSVRRKMKRHSGYSRYVLAGVVFGTLVYVWTGQSYGEASHHPSDYPAAQNVTCWPFCLPDMPVAHSFNNSAALFKTMRGCFPSAGSRRFLFAQPSAWVGLCACCFATNSRAD